MNCIIIDDDKLSRKVIEEYVKKTDFLNLLNIYSSAVEAINSIKSIEYPVHLIFLDIEMPDMTGLDFLESIPNQSPQIVIISAKEKYALKAFEYDVTDYLLKPVNYARFFKAVNKALKRIDDFQNFYFNSNNSDNQEVYIKKNSALVRLKYNDILYIEALENYVIVNTFTEKLTIHFTMKAFEEKLPLKKFKRVHRSFIININHIKGIEDNAVLIEQHDGVKSIPIGKSYKEKLMKDINLIIR
ncbi:MAG: DNA-binding response regulator [Bacteroidetes bacterium HGW-Bacteroidetes-21]|jgi:DNA-binding LytR/AlgR family response regulator|nr:MAG: DNA-binding response regulator [Bacteroidetes bacterium HGW-Bacteroidetes-21]